MPASTQPAFVHHGDWDDHTRSNPAMKWMEQYTIAYETSGVRDRPYTEWNTEDNTFIASDGTVSKGEAGFEANKAAYAPLAKFHHEPYFVVCVETDYGWEMIGQARIYANLAGERGADEPPKIKDNATGNGKGEEWDVMVPGAFRFEYVKDDKGVHDGIRLRKTEIMADNLPVVMTMAKRGLINLG